jgi:hypothetical protein
MKAADKAEQIVLKQGAQSLNLRRETGLWKVSAGAPPAYPADPELVKPLISGIKNLQVEDEISDRADRAADYDLSPESGTRVQLLDAKGATLAEGIFGKQAPDFTHLYFRYPDKPNVFLARGLVKGDLGRLEVNYWRSRQLIDIPEAKIQHIVMDAKGFKTDLVRTSTDAWSVNGKPADPGFVNALIGTYAHSHVDDFVDPSVYPKLTVEGLTFAHVNVVGTDASVDLRIGAQDPKSKRYPASTGKDQGLVWLSQATIDSLLKNPAVFKTK